MVNLYASSNGIYFRPFGFQYHMISVFYYGDDQPKIIKELHFLETILVKSVLNGELKRVTPHYVCFITTCTHLRGIVWCAMAFVVFHRRYSLFECDPAVFVVRFNYFYDGLMFVSNDLNNELICYLLEIRNFNIWQCDSCA